MKDIVGFFRRFHEDESGHAIPGVLSLAGAVGAIVLAIGAACNEDVVTIIGGVALAIGVLGGALGEHMMVDYNIFARVEKLEGKK